jgi:hydrogenase-4 component F
MQSWLSSLFFYVQDNAVYFLLVIPLLAAILCGLIGHRRIIERVTVWSSVLTALFGYLVLQHILTTPVYVTLQPRLGGLLYADSLSAYLVLIICMLGLLAALYSVGYLGYEYEEKLFSSGRLREYYFLFNLFIFTMLLAALANNLGILWVAIEATTLASAFLVGFYNKEESLEAAWKYLIIGSVGITFALFGTVLVYASAFDLAHTDARSLNWTELTRPGIAASLDAQLLKLAFIFILIGYGTKAGLAPMHTWLPDAHSQAPTPISALLSGVLINTAMYAILRYHRLLAMSPVGPDFSGNLLLVFGLISVAIAIFFIVIQQDYKRLFAYSSIKHMGLIATGIGLGTPLAIYASLLHMLNHALTKAFVFMGAGNLLLTFKTKEIARISGAMKVIPGTGVLLLLGVLAITGAPPFGLFVSEFLLLTASMNEHIWLAILLLLLLTIAFAGFLYHIGRMVFGPLTEELKPSEPNPSAFFPLLILFLLILMLGFYIPASLHQLIEQAAKVVKP